MSKRDIRDRLIRIITSTLVREDFSANEQRAILSLLGAPDFYQNLRETVSAVFMAIEDNSGRSRQSNAARAKKLEAASEDTSAASEQLLGEILSLVRRKRLSKAGLLSILNKVSAELASHMTEDASITLIVESFFLHSSDEQRRKLSEILRGDKAGDEYLQGIAERNEP